MQTAINPFYSTRVRRSTILPPVEPNKPIYARLPRVPVTASPVPHLTSLYHFSRAGEYGDRGYPGNCGGNLIKDLLRYFKPRSVFDPMTGSGTCHDVCRELGIACVSGDIHQGLDACDPLNFFGETAHSRGAASTLSGCTRPTGGRNSMPTIPATCRGRRRLMRSSNATRNCWGIADTFSSQAVS